jgi:nucleoid-associated protein YgaU
LNYNITAGLKTVNCTECHYVPVSHLEEPGLHELEPVIEEACLRCHDQKNSPSFEFAAFTERIRHPVIEEVVDIEPIEEEVVLRETPPPEPEISDEPVVEEEDILSEAPTAAEELQEDTVIAEISLTLEPELSEALETVAVTEEVAVEEEVKEEKPTLHLTHEVAAGENLWKLAVQYLSAGKRWPEIYELNRENISNPELILVGQELQIPSSKEKE